MLFIRIVSYVCWCCWCFDFILVRFIRNCLFVGSWMIDCTFIILQLGNCTLLGLFIRGEWWLFSNHGLFFGALIRSRLKLLFYFSLFAEYSNSILHFTVWHFCKFQYIPSCQLFVVITSTVSSHFSIYAPLSQI